MMDQEEDPSKMRIDVWGLPSVGGRSGRKVRWRKTLNGVHFYLIIIMGLIQLYNLIN